jgi:uncharacterized membrane protein YcaP (DUF421 family)
MEEWWTLAMPWWHYVARGTIAYLGLLTLLRLTGKRSFGDMAPFDIVVLVVVGGLLRTAILGKDESLLGPFVAITAILLLDLLLAWLCARSPIMDRLIEGRSIVMVLRGRVISERLREHNVSAGALDRELRSHGLPDATGVEEARLEANGSVSVIKTGNTP